MAFRQPRTSRAGARGTRNTLQGQILNSKRTAKASNATTPFRIQGNKQILSVPSYNFQLKLRKNIRIFNELQATGLTLDLDKIRTNIRAALGGLAAPASGTGELFAVHSIHAYSSAPASQPVSLGTSANSMVMTLFDMEEVSTGVNHISALFEDTATPSGVLHTAAVFPINNRPTFTSSTPNTTLASITQPQVNTLTIDMDVTYTRTPGVTLLMQAGLLTQSLPNSEDLLSLPSLSSLRMATPPFGDSPLDFMPSTPDPAGEFPNHCDQCNFSFKTVRDLLDHYQDEHQLLGSNTGESSSSDQ